MEKVLFSLIKKAALAGGDILLKHFRKSDYDIHAKDGQDVVTSVDTAAESMIVQIIQSIFPKHNILAEERGLIDKKSDYTWIIDPLDGTGNYVRKIPIFGNAIALEKKKEVIMSIVTFPLTGDVFTAFKGEGAYLNDKPLPKLAPTKKKVDELFISFCHGHNRDNVQKSVEHFAKIRPHVLDMRKFGAASMEITHIARGLLDGYIAPGIPEWDFKAAGLIVSETGGTVRVSKDGTVYIFAPGVESLLSQTLKGAKAL